MKAALVLRRAVCRQGPGAGWFVVEGITANVLKGDGWTTDDDMDFYCGGVRPATSEEIKKGAENA